MCTPLAFGGESVFQTLPGTWSGTMTIDGQKVEVARLKVSYIKVCDSCKIPAIRLDFVFKDKDKFYHLPIPAVSFGWGPTLGVDSVAVHGAVHGNAGVAPTSEFVFKRKTDTDDGSNHLDIVLYQDSVPGPGVTLVYTLKENKLVGSITQGENKRAKFAFTRAEAREKAK
jgi:hypothetical protein